MNWKENTPGTSHSQVWHQDGIGQNLKPNDDLCSSTHDEGHTDLRGHRVNIWSDETLSSKQMLSSVGAISKTFISEFSFFVEFPVKLTTAAFNFVAEM